MFKDQKDKWKRKVGNWWGVPGFPTSRSCTGSQPIPYIYDDRFAYEDVSDGLVQMYNMGRQDRKALGLKAREWAIKNFNMKSMITSMDQLFQRGITNHVKPQPRLVTL